MRKRVNILLVGLVSAFMAAGTIYAQEKADPNNTSLGDIARQLRAQKAKEPKPAMVITNDNLPAAQPGESGPSAVSQGKPPSATPPKDKDPEGTSKAHDEAYFRSSLSKLQDQLDTHKRELNVLQQKLGQNDVQYYPNPQDSLMQQYTREDINKLAADIDAKKKQIADDEKAIENLHEQLRREGGDPSWLR